MGVRIGIASTTRELDALFRVRHRVYVEEEAYFPPQPDGRITDRFDAYPTTANLIAIADGRVVGTVRVAEHSDAGNPTDEFFDPWPHLPPGLTGLCSGSMLCVERAYRDTPRLVFSLLGMAYFWGISRGMTHMLGAINPDVEAFFARAGARRLAPPAYHPERGLPAIPMVIELDKLGGAFPSFVRQQQTTHFLDSFEREFLQPGETILRQGDEGHAIYVIVAGRVAIEQRSPRARDHVRIAELNTGDLFGELSLLTERPLTADVVTLSAVDLMVLESDAVASQLRSNPQVLPKMLAMLADRFATRIEPPRREQARRCWW